MTDPTDDDRRLLNAILARFPAVAKGDDRYILNEQGEPEPCPDLLTWMQWYETAERHVCHDMDEGTGAEQVRVSTIFLGLDHRLLFKDDGPPVLWETMVFGGPLDGETRRYASRDAAILGHQEMCRKVSAAQPKHRDD